MAHIDILIYAIVAVVLLARLWSVFGRRNDEDRQRPNPFATPAPDAGDEADEPILEGRQRASGFAPTLTAPTSLAGALERLKQADPAFDEKQFLQTARTIFNTVLAAFAKGDLAPVERYLGPAVLMSFRDAIATRMKSGETLESHVTRIREAETMAANVADTQATITVQFISEQENILRDSKGQIVSGSPGRSEEITDIWMFARELKSSGAEWQVVETRS